MTRTIKILAVMEATTVTGPAKNLLNFCRLARSDVFADAGLPRVEVSIATFHRATPERHGNGSARGDDGDEGEAPNPFVAAARDAGIGVDVIRERARFDPRVIAGLRGAVARRAPNIVQTHMVKSHFLVKLSGLGRERPWVAYHHGYTSTDRKMLAYNQLNRWSLPSAARVITVCGPFAARLAREGVRPERIVVRHNSVVAPPRASVEERHALRGELGVAAGERLVLAVGRLSHEKGHADLVEALGVLREQNTALEWKLVVVGEGPERERVERAARERGLESRIVFAGHAADVRPFYAAADALALPSHSEGSPNVLLEAMAAGLPVVATAVGGVPEIADDEESALLVAPRDARAFADALGRLLTDEGLARRLVASAAARVAAEFSPESYARSLVELYNALAADGTRPALAQTIRG